MYWSKIIAFCLAMTAFTSAHALEDEWAIGMAAPTPTGITLKKWVDNITAYDMFYEWSTRDRRAVVNLDVLTHDFEMLEAETGSMAVYYGFGLHVRYQKSRSPIYGIRIPLGIVYMLENKPLEFFGEFGPRAGVIPETTFAVDMVVGLRYRI